MERQAAAAAAGDALCQVAERLREIVDQHGADALLAALRRGSGPGRGARRPGRRRRWAVRKGQA